MELLRAKRDAGEQKVSRRAEGVSKPKRRGEYRRQEGSEQKRASPGGRNNARVGEM